VRRFSRSIHMSILFSVLLEEVKFVHTYRYRHFENWSLPYPIKHLYCIAFFTSKILSTVLFAFTLYLSFVTCECRIPYFISFSSSSYWIFLIEIFSIFVAGLLPSVSMVGHVNLHFQVSCSSEKENEWNSIKSGPLPCVYDYTIQNPM